MCVSLHPAKFSKTTVGVWEALNGRRYLGYGNTALSLIGKPSAPATPSRPTRRGSRGSSALGLTAPRKPSNWQFEDAVTPQPKHAGNALILPIPDDVDNIEVIDTETCKNFLSDIRQALTPVSRGGLRRGPVDFSVDSKVRIVQMGIYTVVISKSASAIARALTSGGVPAEKRPALSKDILDAYQEWYPDWAIAVCCFNNTEAKSADPLLFSYEPTKQDDPDMFFVPTLDAHDGKRPDLNASVDVDHTIFVATANQTGGTRVHYTDSDMAPGIAQILPDSVLGKAVESNMRNGDIVFRRSDLESGVLKGLRALPPGAPAAKGKALYI